MKRTIILPLSVAGMVAAMLWGCDLTERMQVQADKAMIFGSESGLQTYTYSFYSALPALNNAFRQDVTADYAAVSDTDKFIKEGAYNAETSTSWSWTALRNINYFIDGCNDPKYCTVDASTRDNYIGIARWFRAWFYYDKLSTYGEVPWFGSEIQSYQENVMYKDRDSRDVIIRNIISDLDFAYENIKATSSVGSSTVTKWAAAALKSRICLFEASFRKYHGRHNMELTSEYLYSEAAAAARLVMDNSGLSLNMAKGTKGAYRDLFYRQDPITSEVILAVCANEAASILGEQNWWYNSRSYGKCWSLVKPFVNTYLMTDGTPYTSRDGWESDSFVNEMSGRDERLVQTVRGPSFTFDGKITPANIQSLSLTGYQVIKYTLDESKYEGGAKNINSIPLIRYAEVLLNYAEAMAETGKITDSDWGMTIGAIRKRAGITGGTEKLPTTIDTYLQSTFYPGINDPVILEIRRERAIELVAEGFRYKDLMRWACGKLLETLPWTGIHISGLDVPIDINGDGVDDYYFTSSSYIPSAYKGISISVNRDNVGLYAEPDASGGYNLVYKVAAGDRCWYDDGRQYLYPIPAKVIRDYRNAGYTISQNPYWTE